VIDKILFNGSKILCASCLKTEAEPTAET